MKITAECDAQHDDMKLEGDGIYFDLQEKMVCDLLA